ncbi:neuropeptide Y receptor type 5-like [Centruroides sculpturatus]|uniref:neuropeptide Y receptor type 5-like n=2 Tax=Centruroides sculpturatus TaxID=218467 RepID=UPI000C6D2C53|nr:neuropeptide Y receptor type 5-like [Centruroides sculpturatus]
MKINITDIFNFSMEQASAVLEEYTLRDHIFSSPIETTIVISYCILMTSGVCSNLLISIVILKNTKIRTNRNLLVVNLSMTDIALCIFCMPFTLLQLIRKNWVLGSVLCKLVPFFQGSTIFIMAGTVMAIAIERHNAIVRSHIHRTIICKKFCICTISIWVISLILSIPVCLFQKVVPIRMSGFILSEKCMEHWPSGHIKSIYTVVVLLMQFVIPTMILIATHCRVRTYLNIKIAHPHQEIAPGYKERLRKELKRNERATMILLNLSIVFTISWLPWNIVNLIADFHPKIFSPETLYLIFALCHIIAMTSATTNPILYGWLNTNIRRELLKMGEVVGIVLSSHSRPTSNNGSAVQVSDGIEMRNTANSN